ncbi:MAG: hypothetical protein HPQ69_01895 [Marine Group I thaumarchaeote]|nr:MAG: hypothetical protein HPQ69_01895 [Marine Group I thaumarchaeote]
MTIAKENKEFINSLIEYYISESESYREIAEEFRPEVESVQDTAFGIITGCVYSGFLQAYQNQQQTASLEDIKEFNEMIKQKAPEIKKAISSQRKTDNQSNNETE